MAKGWRTLILALAISLTGCGRSGRYVLVSENVAAGSGANEYSTPLPVRGNIYRLDTKTGEVILLTGTSGDADNGERGVLSLRVFSPEESNAILAKRESQAKTPPPTPTPNGFDEFLKTYASPTPSSGP